MYVMSSVCSPDCSLVITDSTSDDVKKLKVYIELDGLRLNKPLPRREHGERSAKVIRKFRMDVLAVRGRSKVNGGWGDPALVRRVGPRGKTNN